MARGAPSDPEFQIVNAIALDDWDNWNMARDSAALASTSYQYVPEGVYGTEDLDQNGQWDSVPDYGYCWRPAVVAGWAPYSMGRWVWEDWYGWTWISYDPWGWAPYHYGRWFYRANFGWAGIPARGACTIGPRRWWGLSVGVGAASGSGLAISAGCRWLPTKSSIRGGAAATMAGQAISTET